jgi:hypothetical protein
MHQVVDHYFKPEILDIRASILELDPEICSMLSFDELCETLSRQAEINLKVSSVGIFWQNSNKTIMPVADHALALDLSEIQRSRLNS